MDRTSARPRLRLGALCGLLVAWSGCAESGAPTDEKTTTATTRPTGTTTTTRADVRPPGDVPETAEKKVVRPPGEERRPGDEAKAEEKVFVEIERRPLPDLLPPSPDRGRPGVDEEVPAANPRPPVTGAPSRTDDPPRPQGKGLIDVAPDVGPDVPTPKAAVVPDNVPGSGRITPGPSIESAQARVRAVLKKAEVAFNKPSSMQLGATVSMQLKLSRSESADALKAAITGPVPAEAAEVAVSDLVVARLAGAGFDIKPGVGTDRPQVIQAEGTKSWQWDVTALAPGKHQLHLTINSVVKVDGTEADYEIQSFDEPIDVQVTWGQQVAGFVGSNWQWLGTAIVIPVAGYLVSRRRKATA